MSGIALELIVILLLVVLNGFFSMAEIALLSCRRTRDPLDHRRRAHPQADRLE